MSIARINHIFSNIEFEVRESSEVYCYSVIGGPPYRIVFSVPFIVAASKEDLEFVVGHEISHFIFRHHLLRAIRILAILLSVGYMIAIGSFVGAAVVMVIALLIHIIICRSEESGADKFAFNMVRHGKVIVDKESFDRMKRDAIERWKRYA